METLVEEKKICFELIEADWAEALTIPPNVRYVSKYVWAGQLARQTDKGMWSARL